MIFDELNVRDAVISQVESVAIVSVAELKMSFTHSVLYVEVMKPSWCS